MSVQENGNRPSIKVTDGDVLAVFPLDYQFRVDSIEPGMVFFVINPPVRRGNGREDRTRVTFFEAYYRPETVRTYGNPPPGIICLEGFQGTQQIDGREIALVPDQETPRAVLQNLFFDDYTKNCDRT